MKKILLILVIIVILVINCFEINVYGAAIEIPGYVFFKIYNIEETDKVDALMEVYSSKSVSFEEIQKMNKGYNDELIKNNFAMPYDENWYKVSDLYINFERVTYDKNDKTAIYCLSYHYDSWLDNIKILINRENKNIISEILDISKSICLDNKVDYNKIIEFDCNDGKVESQFSIQRFLNGLFNNNGIKLIILGIIVVLLDLLILKKYKVNKKMSITMLNILSYISIPIIFYFITKGTHSTMFSFMLQFVLFLVIDLAIIYYIQYRQLNKDNINYRKILLYENVILITCSIILGFWTLSFQNYFYVFNY